MLTSNNLIYKPLLSIIESDYGNPDSIQCVILEISVIT